MSAPLNLTNISGHATWEMSTTPDELFARLRVDPSDSESEEFVTDVVAHHEVERTVYITRPRPDNSYEGLGLRYNLKVHEGDVNDHCVSALYYSPEGGLSIGEDVWVDSLPGAEPIMALYEVVHNLRKKLNADIVSDGISHGIPFIRGPTADEKESTGLAADSLIQALRYLHLRQQILGTAFEPGTQAGIGPGVRPLSEQSSSQAMQGVLQQETREGRSGGGENGSAAYEEEDLSSEMMGLCL